MKSLKGILTDHILVLDGASGTMIQKYGFKEEDFRGREFLHHPKSLYGFNDILNLTKPSAIKKIHRQYLEAGANIITTNTFNSNHISMKDYGLDDIEGLSRKLNRAGAQIAREAIEEFGGNSEESIRLAGGSIGPTNRSCSMSPDIADPLKRNISYDELFAAYKEQAEGLIEGGVDLLIFETFFDTLNLKAGLNAAIRAMEEKEVSLPIMVSATVSDNAGRLLSGQDLKAFVTSISHFKNVEVIGLNCGFGPERMKNYIREIRSVNPHFTSCHPNAGLPDTEGCYDVSPEEFGESIKTLLEEGCLNIVGGCCGTTPEYVKVLSRLVKDIKPTSARNDKGVLRLSGLNMLETDNGFITVGERCNVAGSAKFLRLIKEGAFEEAADIAKAQVEKGAEVIDLNMDDAMLDSKKEMVDFLRYILAEPEIAKVPFMIDSSKWEVIEAALKEIQGKGIVNSLSLKEGEDEFIRKASRVRELGFALVVMAFDEKGQADTFERKIEVAERAYRILTQKCGYSPEDIIFDVNIMTIATGMPEHSKYALDFIKAVEWIKKNLPGARTSGGVSNLSFAFRGKNKIREYMHVIFLHHAKKAGLDMAIISPAQKTRYEEIPEETKTTIEDIIFDRNPDAVEKLLEIAANESGEKKEKKPENVSDNTNAPIEDILISDLMHGELRGLDDHINRALEEIKDPVRIIEGPLLEGMKRVGTLFGEGKMFLPQVVKTARSMKRAVEILTPHIENSNINKSGKKAGKIVIATVKGDVHDIGKNIVSTVLACNNFEIIDLGIMVPAEKIVETALKEQPDIICLSGLITPSLGEMANTVRLLSEAGIKVPVMVGGAATSLLHTALKIDPEYDGIVLHMGDASQNPVAAATILNPDKKEEYIEGIKTRYAELNTNDGKKDALIPFKEVLKRVEKENRNEIKSEIPRHKIGEILNLDIDLSDILPLINWKMFFLAWKIQGKYIESFPLTQNEDEKQKWLSSLTEEEKTKAKEALQLYATAGEIVRDLQENDKFDGKALLKFVKAMGNLKNITIDGKEFPMLRQQMKDSNFLSCSDFISDKDGYLGMFCVTAGNQIDVLSKELERKGDTYRAFVAQALADRIAEASAEWLHAYASKNFMEVSIRPAWGYPMLPDQTLILETKDIIPYEEIGVSLTENGAMYPSSSISGMFISDPKAKYFMVGQIGEDQIEDYAKRKGTSPDEIKKILRII